MRHSWGDKVKSDKSNFRKEQFLVAHRFREQSTLVRKSQDGSSHYTHNQEAHHWEMSSYDLASSSFNPEPQPEEWCRPHAHPDSS